MKKEIGIGVVGTGFMGKTHTYAYATLPLFYDPLPFKTRLVGVCSRKLANAQRARDEYGFEMATDSLDDLLRREDIHVIHVCTPNALHAGQLKAAVLAGKHVYCDKPLAMTADEAREIAALANKSGLTAQVALQNRFFPATLRAKELMEEGKIGDVLSFRACYLHASLSDPVKPLNWKQDVAQSGGGVLIDMGSHVIDLIYHLLGKYARVFCETHIAYAERPDAAGVMRRVEAEDAAVVLARMESGALGTIEASKIATGANDELKFEIHGSKGAMRFSLMEPSWLEFYDNTLPEAALGGNKGMLRIDCLQKYPAPGGAFPNPKFSVGWLRGHVHCIYCFLMHVALGEPGFPSFDDGAYVQHVMERAYRSRDEQRWVEV